MDSVCRTQNYHYYYSFIEIASSFLVGCRRPNAEEWEKKRFMYSFHSVFWFLFSCVSLLSILWVTISGSTSSRNQRISFQLILGLVLLVCVCVCAVECLRLWWCVWVCVFLHACGNTSNEVCFTFFPTLYDFAFLSLSVFSCFIIFPMLTVHVSANSWLNFCS